MVWWSLSRTTCLLVGAGLSQHMHLNLSRSHASPQEQYLVRHRLCINTSKNLIKSTISSDVCEKKKKISGSLNIRR